METSEIIIEETTDNVELEKELKKFNWGAFGLSIFWGIGNKSYLTLLCLIPLFNIVWVFVCGFKGNQWAWENGSYSSFEQFKETQDSWKVPGIVSFALCMASIVLSLIIVIGIILAGVAYYPHY